MTNRQELRPAFFYGRVSTDGQDRELSIGEQKQHANEQAPREGYRFIQEFEEVKSAATDKRPAFLEMVSLAISPNRPAEAIFFNDLSRAFRNDEDFYMYRRMLREANVKIFTYEEGELKNDDQSQLMFGFKSLLNSQVPRKTARETRRGQFGATRRGFYLGLGVFGYEKYKVMDGGVEHIKLRPHPTQWEHLLSMFRMALENHGGRRIADHLNSLGVKTRLGNDWKELTVLGVLRNPACRGKTHRGENSRSPYLDRSERVFCENAHEAAVSEEDYQTIERLIKLRTTNPGGPRAHSSPNPLSDHVKCGLCGSNMTLNRIKGITILVCSNKRKDGKRACPAKNTRLDILMPRVVAALLERILTEETLRQQVALVAETNREFLVEQQTARETIEKNIAGTKKQISNLVDAIEGRGGNPQIYERLDDRESELKQLTVQLEGLNEKLTGHLEFLNAPDRIVSCALDLRTYIESEDPEVARMFILSFVKRVEVLGTEAIIHYKMPLPQDVTGGTKTTDTVKIAKNGDRQESWLSPTPAGVGLWVNFWLPWWAGAAIGIPIALVFYYYSVDDISGVLSPTPAGALEISQWGSYEGSIRDGLVSPSLDPNQPDAMLPYAVALNQARQWVNDIKALPSWFLPDGPREQTKQGLYAAYRGFIGADSWDLEGGPKKESMAAQRAVGGGGDAGGG